MSALGYAALVLLVLVLCLILKPQQPAIALLLCVAACLLLIFRASEGIGQLYARVEQMFSSAGLSAEWYGPVFRAVGVCMLARLLSAFCRDAGQQALAVQVEMAGAAAALLFCLPLYQQVLQLAAGGLMP